MEVCIMLVVVFLFILVCNKIYAFGCQKGLNWDRLFYGILVIIIILYFL